MFCWVDSEYLLSKYFLYENISHLTFYIAERGTDNVLELSINN